MMITVWMVLNLDKDKYSGPYFDKPDLAMLQEEASLVLSGYRLTSEQHAKMINDPWNDPSNMVSYLRACHRRNLQLEDPT